MLQLSRLPDQRDVILGDVILDGEEVEDDVRLLDDLHVKVRTEQVRNDLIFRQPVGQLAPDQLHLRHRLGGANVIEKVDMSVDLRHSRQPHGERRRREVFEGQGESLGVERDLRVQRILNRRPHEVLKEEKLISSRKRRWNRSFSPAIDFVAVDRKS